jgi:hypothetical protein
MVKIELHGLDDQRSDDQNYSNPISPSFHVEALQGEFETTKLRYE